MRTAGYFDLDELERRLDGHEVIEIGRSTEGRAIWGAMVGEASLDEVVVVAGNIHGIEHISAHVALEFLDRVGEWTALRGRARVLVIPVLNPDGFQRTFETGGEGTIKALRTNARGVDLNRNFPAPGPYTRWPFGGTDDERKPTWRGPSPASEPEVRALIESTAGMNVRAIASLHSFMGSLVTPRLPDRVSYRAYDRLLDAFRAAQTEHRYWRLASRFVDGFTGELEDYFHHERDAWAVCVETFTLGASFRQHLFAPQLFWRFNPRDPARWARHDAPAVAAFLQASLEAGRPSELAVDAA